MRKINTNETFIEFYLSEKYNMPCSLIISIINANYLTRYNDNSLKLQQEVVDFITEFKKDNENIFFSLKDLPIVKFYDKILNDRITIQRKKINNELTIQESLIAKSLSQQIFEIKKDFMYSITIDTQSFMNFASSQIQLENELKVLLHNKNGIILFYFKIEEKNICFGFKVNKSNFEEIKPVVLQQYNHQKEVNFMTFKKFLELRSECF